MPLTLTLIDFCGRELEVSSKLLRTHNWPTSLFFNEKYAWIIWTRTMSISQIREQMSGPKISKYEKSILGCGLWSGLDCEIKGFGPIMSQLHGLQSWLNSLGSIYRVTFACIHVIEYRHFLQQIQIKSIHIKSDLIFIN